MSEYAVINPATGETLSKYPTFTDEETKEAVSKAAQAYTEYARDSKVSDRADLLHKVAQLHRDRSEKLADIIVKEMGKTRVEALGEVDFSADIYDFYADHAEEITKDRPIEDLLGEGTALIRHAPYGPLLGIMPWNFPYYQVARFAAPNILNGNTILLKHAPQCPESAEAIQQMFDDAGAHTGLYINVRLTNEQAATVVADPRIQGVSVTGSERAGSAVAEVAGKNLKKVALELGGSDPFYLFSTNDIDTVVTKAVAARIGNNGEACNAAKRFIIVQDLYQEFVDLLTSAFAGLTLGDPMNEDTDLGPLSSDAATDRLEEQVNRAVEQGATLVYGGKRKGNFFEPTILTDVTPDMDAYREELFGPVAVVYKAVDEEQALLLGNDVPFGLGSYVFTTDKEQAERVANAIDAGMVYINIVDADSAELPFGGVKRSGFGRELGLLGAGEFVNKKLVRADKWTDAQQEGELPA